MDFSTADLCDKFGKSLQVAKADFNSYGGVKKCFGKIATIKIDEDNSELVSMLQEDGDGRIAVVDVGRSYCAVVGDTLMGYALKNNWAGIIVNGYVRDTEETAKIPVGLWAIGTCPLKSKKKAKALRDIELNFSDVKFKNEDFLYADSDGIVVLSKDDKIS